MSSENKSSDEASRSLITTALQLEWLKMNCTLGTIRGAIIRKDKAAIAQLFSDGDNSFRPQILAKKKKAMMEEDMDTETTGTTETTEAAPVKLTAYQRMDVEAEEYNLNCFVTGCLEIDRVALNFLYKTYGDCSLQHFYKRVSDDYYVT